MKDFAVPIPENSTELRSFLGFPGYFRIFIQGIADILAALCSAIPKNVRFKWTPEKNAAFETLKERLTDSPVLTFPRFEDPFQVETDAFTVVVGAVLSQKKADGKMHQTKSLNFL